MQLDIGLTGFGLLIALSLTFGAVAQLVGRPGTRWLWLIAAAGWFVGGLYASEVIWGALTVDEIQPIVDGLALDESLLGGLVGGLLVTMVTRYVTGGSPFHRSPAA